MSKPRAPRRAVDPRSVGPIAHVVDSAGRPVTHTWTNARGRRVTSTIGLYWQETSLPADEKGIHTVWSSDEDHGDTYPWKRREPAPEYLTRFMREASSGQLSATFALTPWGREAAAARCRCRGGGPLREAERTESKRNERGGMSSREWKKHQRRLRMGESQ